MSKNELILTQNIHPCARVTLGLGGVLHFIPKIFYAGSEVKPYTGTPEPLANKSMTVLQARKPGNEEARYQKDSIM